MQAVQYADAFNKWKRFIFFKSKKQLAETLKKVEVNTFNNKQTREKVKLKRAAMLLSDHKQNTVKVVWDALVENKKVRALFNQKTKEFKEKQKNLQL